MRLSRFINEHIDEILIEWESFAKTLGPAADTMSNLALRDHAKGILQAIALDIESWQDPELQYKKSQGLAPEIHEGTSAAATHGAVRQARDFSLIQLSAEFRALRATVLRLWLPQVTQMSATTIYEMVRLNEAIDQALAESVVTYSTRADRMRDLFLAILGHELRAPLASITTGGALLAHTNIASDEVLRIGGRIERNGRQMSRMVDDLVGYSQTQLGGGMPITLDHADLKEICQSALENASAAHPDCQFVLETTGNLGGSFDAVRLKQLLSNILLNAAQYGATERPITIDASGDPQTVTIAITNFGPVIPEESLQSIFQPLVQLPIDGENGRRPRTSLGLGLFVAREIAELHGGTIAVTSDPVDGTSFTVSLPRKGTD